MYFDLSWQTNYNSIPAILSGKMSAVEVDTWVEVRFQFQNTTQTETGLAKIDLEENHTQKIIKQQLESASVIFAMHSWDQNITENDTSLKMSIETMFANSNFGDYVGKLIYGVPWDFEIDFPRVLLEYSYFSTWNLQIDLSQKSSWYPLSLPGKVQSMTLSSKSLSFNLSLYWVPEPGQTWNDSTLSLYQCSQHAISKQLHPTFNPGPMALPYFLTENQISSDNKLPVLCYNFSRLSHCDVRPVQRKHHIFIRFRNLEHRETKWSWHESLKLCQHFASYQNNNSHSGHLPILTSRCESDEIVNLFMNSVDMPPVDSLFIGVRGKSH